MGLGFRTGTIYSKLLLAMKFFYVVWSLVWEPKRTPQTSTAGRRALRQVEESALYFCRGGILFPCVEMPQ